MITRFLAKASIVPKQRSPYKTPFDYGMQFSDVSFKSDDGINLKAWYIPAKSNKLIIFTHPMPFNRYGFHIKGQGLVRISNVEVELLRVVRNLHDAGYGVLTMDLRNHGDSGKCEKGVCTIGYNEWKDVAAAMKYIKTNDELSNKQVGMVVNCLGANSSLIAMSKEKKLFEDIKAVVAIQPVSYNVFLKNFLCSELPLFKNLLPGISNQIKDLAGVGPEEMSPAKYLKDLKAPVMYVQVRKDSWTENSDVQSFYDLTSSEKELFWIEGDLHRFDGYNYFGDEPEKMLSWLDKYMQE